MITTLLSRTETTAQRYLWLNSRRCSERYTNCVSIIHIYTQRLTCKQRYRLRNDTQELHWKHSPPSALTSAFQNIVLMRHFLRQKFCFCSSPICSAEHSAHSVLGINPAHCLLLTMRSSTALISKWRKLIKIWKKFVISQYQLIS